ncbi:hypothetical protein GUITHDRAFT_117003 [Guillardia theta CCMP2712]|uniref:Uncharacterized protein n=1 Tax=Guillardia theta (strain CCMP2712) TaxID=905079 RepID=L1IL51_GUITC|nr:hypothetical protein GUITHDRAFT_117003 [Guillardia theta CCMP2712]EKX36837.1 hypothetical protein GUITHDRAFT_117003 [Guillardia theta CCMP2712]|mmetsp:Transcript_46008/g.144328  ORF Transcript_46008/g.144328 Transcript_46008/m.144328 type:complete len:156 (-) Transcript_46008:2506-2973(-)|eukprot:XP_005823817.1 hypothetical protein GUITHDRAFT_117003 [Guillardia theta CCMP2712]
MSDSDTSKAAKKCSHGTCAVVGFCVRDFNKMVLRSSPIPDQLEFLRRQPRLQQGDKPVTIAGISLRHQGRHITPADLARIGRSESDLSIYRKEKSVSIILKDLKLEFESKKKDRFYLRKEYFSKAKKRPLDDLPQPSKPFLLNNIESVRKRMKGT